MAFACKAMLFVAVLAAVGHAESWEPMVAFVCNRGSMYYSKGGWVSDRTTDCLDNPKDVLAYCQKLFPDEDVTNIVEANGEMEIAGWCPTTATKCASKEVFSVRPFRCLRGAFQSDALVVPKQCKFDYVRNSDKCRTYDWWGAEARRACSSTHGMTIQSYGMLLPCDTDLFNGVEFVCCPEAAKEESSSSSRDDDDESPKPVITVKASKKSSELRGGPAKDAGPRQPTPAAADEAAATLDRYLRMSVDKSNVNEHEAFTLTKQVLEADTETKLQNIMKEWATAKSRVLELQTVDAKEAEKLNKEVTLRFQKEYFAQQSQGEAALQRVESVHQQHVYSILNEKKRVAVELLIRKIDDFAEPEAIVKYLQRYISLEQKDAEQCLRHYLNERDRNPADSAMAGLKEDTIDHLRLISTRIRQGIDLVSGYPDKKVADEIQASTRNWMKKGFLDVDSVVQQMSSEPSSGGPSASTPAKSSPAAVKGKAAAIKPAGKAPPASADGKAPPAAVGGDGKGVQAPDARKVPSLAAKEPAAKQEASSSQSNEWDDGDEWDDTPNPKKQADAGENGKSSVGSEEPGSEEPGSEEPGSEEPGSEESVAYDNSDDKNAAVQLTAQQIQTAYADELQQQPHKDDANDKPDQIDYNDGDDTKEDEHAYFFKDAKAVKGQAANAMKASPSIDEQEFAPELGHVSSLKAGTAVAIAGGVLVALGIIVGAVIVVRRKQDIQTSRRASYIEVAMDMSPEELHVMQMQMNGYENPTYRFLEMQQQAVPQQQQAKA